MGGIWGCSSCEWGGVGSHTESKYVSCVRNMYKTVQRIFGGKDKGKDKCNITKHLKWC